MHSEQCNDLIMLAHIACRASNHEVLRSIRATFRNGNDMIDMIVSANLFLAIVALPFLM